MDIAMVLGLLRRRFLLILLAVVVAAAAGFAISVSQEPIYAASTPLLLRGSDGTRGGGSGASPTGSEFGSPLPGTAADREALVLAGPILARVEDELVRPLGGRAPAEEAVRRVSAVAAAESDVVTITAEASGPRVAALVANTVARENIAYRRETAIAKIRRALQTAERTRRTLGSGQSAGDQVAVQQLEQRLSSLRQAASLQTGDAEVLSKASAPASPTSPKPLRDALIGGFAGLLLGIGAALLREQLDRRLRDPKDLERATGLPVLADVPKSRALDSKKGQGRTSLPAREAEAFQMLRANLRYVNAQRELRSVLITSAGVADGKSTIAFNLARADASTGGKVLLIDADIRRPRLATLIGLSSDEPGLSMLLSERNATLADAVLRIPVVRRSNGTGATHTMDVLVAGRVPPNPSELIDSDRMRAVLREAEAAYDLVVIDSPPAAIVSDAIPLMGQVSAVIVVGKVGATTSGQARNLREQLERVDAPAFGVVANFASGGAESYGYGYY
jgi:capsular exopolysaccharide synthesis family protein